MGAGHAVHVQRERPQRDSPATEAFRQPEVHAAESPVALRSDKLYISTNILDSGDAHWYWQFHQRDILVLSVRGTVPTGYGMNVTLLDALPLVAQWTHEVRMPRDSFFVTSITLSPSDVSMRSTPL